MNKKPTLSQNVILQYDACPMKAYLQYIKGWDWTPYDQNTNEYLEKGNKIHRVAQSYFSEIPYKNDIGKPDENVILKNLKEGYPKESGIQYFSERKMMTEFETFYLSGILDLIQVKDGQYTIADWKLGNISRNLSRFKVQADIYMHLLSFKTEYGMPIKFEFCNLTGDPKKVKFEYDWSQKEEYSKSISEKAENILNFSEKDFEKELYSEVCDTCIYRKICE